jgi:hypothetical protein
MAHHRSGPRRPRPAQQPPLPAGRAQGPYLGLVPQAARRQRQGQRIVALQSASTCHVSAASSHDPRPRGQKFDSSWMHDRSPRTRGWRSWSAPLRAPAARPGRQGAGRPAHGTHRNVSEPFLRVGVIGYRAEGRGNAPRTIREVSAMGGHLVGFGGRSLPPASAGLLLVG